MGSQYARCANDGCTRSTNRLPRRDLGVHRSVRRATLHRSIDVIHATHDGTERFNGGLSVPTRNALDRSGTPRRLTMRERSRPRRSTRRRPPFALNLRQPWGTRDRAHDAVDRPCASSHSPDARTAENAPTGGAFRSGAGMWGRTVRSNHRRLWRPPLARRARSPQGPVVVPPLERAQGASPHGAAPRRRSPCRLGRVLRRSGAPRVRSRGRFAR